jgi:acetyl esterase/lipase
VPFSAFATHLNRPAGPAPPRLNAPVSLRRDQAYTPAGTPPLLADVYLPQLPGPLPAVLMIHGGGWSGGTRRQTAALARRVARRGYVVVNAAYRLAPAARFPAPVEDLQQALRWMRANSASLGLDPARIGAWGYSAGAHLAALLAALRPGDRLYAADARLAAVVAGGIPADLHKFRGGRLLTQFLGEKWTPDSALYRESSPAAYVAAGAPPVFLYHGTLDRLVPPDQSTDYQQALQAAGVVNELYLMHGLGHVTAYFFDRTTTRLGADFLDRHLRGSPQP